MGKCAWMGESERERESKGCNWLYVRVHGDDPVKMRQNESTRGRVLGAEWNGRYLKQCTDLRDLPQDVCISSLPREKGEKKKERSSALSTPFLPLRPLLQPPAAPSHSSYEPRAGRSEYNFLYCVNVRTIRLNKKKNVYITKRRRLNHCAFHPPRGSSVHKNPWATSPRRTLRPGDSLAF